MNTLDLEPTPACLALIYRHRGTWNWSIFMYYPDNDTGLLNARLDLERELERTGKTAIQRVIVRMKPYEVVLDGDSLSESSDL